MAQTTTAVNACNVKIEVDNVSGTLTEVSGSTNNASIDMSSQTGETFTFQGQWSIRKACKTSATISLTALYTTADAEALAILRDWYFNNAAQSRTVKVSVPDGVAGSDEYSGEFILESLSIPLSADDAGVILVSASLANDGAFSYAEIAS